MKRITIWLFIAIFTFAVSVIATLFYINFTEPITQKAELLSEFTSNKNENNLAELPTLTYCELINEPERYNDKIIRLNAKLSRGLEGSWFSDPNCGKDNAAIISSIDKELWQRLEQARKQKKNKFPNYEFNLVVVGRFKNKSYNDHCCLKTPFQFEILQVESVSNPD